LAKAVGGTVADAFPWDSHETCVQETLGNQWDELKKAGYRVDSSFVPLEFETRSEKFDFSNADIDKLPAYNAFRAPGDEKSFPLTLIPFDTMRLTAGYIGSPPFLVKSLEDTVLAKNDVLVEVHPATAKNLGLSQGDDAVLSTPKGNAKVKVHLYDGIMPDLVGIVTGLGHTAYDKFLSGKGVNPYRLMSSVEDPGTGLEAAWGVRVKLTKA
jgi:anaerobic selenocysteine-containing dehydrogenase